MRGHAASWYALAKTEFAKSSRIVGIALEQIETSYRLQTGQNPD